MRLLDYLIIIAYFGGVVYIGIRTKRSVHGSGDFFLSGRSLPALTTGLAYLAASMGSFDLMGGTANAAKYGMFTNHLYWIGSVPAMFFSTLSSVGPSTCVSGFRPARCWRTCTWGDYALRFTPKYSSFS